MFRIVQEPTFKRDVSVLTPADGGHRTEKLTAVYRLLPIDKLKDFDFETLDGPRDFLKAAVVSLDELEDESGQPIAWNDEVRDLLFGLMHVRTALVRTYFEAVGKATVGNSNGPAALG